MEWVEPGTSGHEERRLAATAGEELAPSVLDTVFASAGVGLCLIGPDGRVLRANAQWLRTAGFTAARAIGKDIWELFPSSSPDLHHLYDRVRAGETVDFPAHLQILNGREVWYEGRLSPVHQLDGTGVLVTALDITERKRAEEALRVGEARYRAFFDSLTELVLVLEAVRDERGEVVDWLFRDANEAVLRHLGLAREQIVGRRGTEVFSADWVARAMPEYTRVLASGEPSRRETVLEGVHYLRSLFRMGENTLGLASLDITDRKDAEEALRASEERFRTVTENAPDVIARFDRCHRYLFVSRAVRDAMGRPPEAFLGKTNAEAAMPDDLVELWDAHVQAVFDTGAPRSVEFGFTGPSGPRWFEARLVPEHAGDGKVESVLSIARDITAARQSAEDERRARREAERIGELQRLVMGVVSHDLRSPLQSIKISAELLVQQGRLTQAQAERVLRISRSADRAGDIIRDLLDATRVRQGQMLHVERQRVDLEELCQRLVAEARSIHPDRVIDFASTGPCPGAFDPVRLGQLVSNLLANALLHGGPKSRVAVRLQTGGGAVQLSVFNDGPPIPPDQQAIIFEPFRRVNAGFRGRGGGVGLGLFIVREIARAHGGCVSVASDAERGTTFTVRMPVGG